MRVYLKGDIIFVSSVTPMLGYGRFSPDILNTKLSLTVVSDDNKHFVTVLTAPMRILPIILHPTKAFIMSKLINHSTGVEYNVRINDR